MVTPIQVRVVAVALSMALAPVGASCRSNDSANDQASGTNSSLRMADGNEWMTENLNVNTDPSWCYDDAEVNCGRYGRLYTWESAQRACQSLGGGWRLPTNGEWRQLATSYGGLRDESADNGAAASKALASGGSTGFNALPGGSRSAAGEYARLNAHGFYWTASESAPGTAWFYNFGQGGLSVSRHSGGDKQMAASVRCIRD